MNKKKLLLLLAFPLFLLAGCGHDDIEGGGPDIPVGQNGDIKFKIGFVQPDGVAYATEDNDAPRTRVATDNQFRSTWEDGDEIGIFAVTHGQPLAASDNFIHNVKLTYSSADDSWSGAVYWPTASSGITSLDFYAYYPYDDNGGAPATLNPIAITFTVKTDQSGKTTVGSVEKSNYNLSDLLTAKADNTGSGYGKGETVSLQFSHALAMVQVSIDDVKYKALNTNEDITVELRNVRTAAGLNLFSGAVAASGDAGGVTMRRIEQPSDADYESSFTFRALIPAQVVARDARIFLISNGDLLLNGSPLTAQLDMTARTVESFTQQIPYTALPFIPAGSFIMGSPGNEPNRGTNETQHKVTLTKGFYITKYAITNSQYVEFLNAKGIQGEMLKHSYIPGAGGNMIGGEYNGEHLVYEGNTHQWGVKWNTDKWIPQPGYEDHPVVWVTWYGAKAYAEWVGGSLPTEAQWEYACRGDKGSLPFGVGDGYKLDNTLANFDWKYSWSWDGSSPTADITDTGTCPGVTQAVGSYSPNSYGLYDMHGNVLEWCLDNSDGVPADYGGASVTDPTGPTTGYGRVLRGGYYGYDAQYCRSAYRFNSIPDYASRIFGFRVVVVP